MTVLTFRAVSDGPRGHRMTSPASWGGQGAGLTRPERCSGRWMTAPAGASLHKSARDQHETALQEQDRASAWRRASREVSKSLAGRHRESFLQAGTSEPDELVVVLRVAQKKYDRVLITVAQFQSQLSLESLQVAWACLGLDGHMPPVPIDPRVPGSQVAGERQWDLGLPSQALFEPRSKALEQRVMGSVADRSTRRKCPRRKLESDDGQESRRLDDRELGRNPATDPAHLRA